MKLTKNYKNAVAQIESGKVYTVTEGVELLQKIAFAKFNETVTVSFNLGVDPKQADQQIRGALVLPHGTGKTKTVLAVTRNEEAAKAAGADYVGTTEVLDKIKAGWFDFDVIVATPDMMGELGKLGKILGPKGLMPNPKTGTVSPDIAKAIQAQKAGSVNYRVDKEGNMAIVAGQVKFEAAKLVENIITVCNTVNKVKPAACKGVYIKSCTISGTMTPGIAINPESK